MTTTYDIRLPRPYAMQRDIQVHPAKRKVICAGRRAGKTTLTSIVAIRGLLAGRHVLYATPKQEQADAFWDKCNIALSEPLAHRLIQKNETKHTLRMGKGAIRAKTAFDADTLRGDYADLLIFDEYAYMDADAWDKVGAPMLLDNDGDAWFVSTPNRRNHFFRAYQRAKADGGRWHAWEFSSHENPHLSESALTEIAHELTEDGYKQEILAQFLDDSGAVFRKITDAATAIEAPYIPEHQYVMGVDLARKVDFTVCAVLDLSVRPYAMVSMDRFNQVDWKVQRGRIGSMAERYHADQLVVDQTGVGDPVVEQLRRDLGIAVRGVQFTNAVKVNLVESLSLAFERGSLAILNDPVLVGELQAFELKRLPSGMIRYSAPEGAHDDCVCALALAYSAAEVPSGASLAAVW